MLSSIKNSFAQTTKTNSSVFVDTSTYSPLINLEPGLVYPSSIGGFNASLVFTLDGGLTVEIPQYELERPLRLLDKDGSRVLQPMYNEIQVFKDAAPEDGPVLGKVFLSQVRET
jgi:hypothetical protein